MTPGASEATDVAVVGAGITGLSIAWHLATAGVEVCVYDGRGIGSGATAIQPGGVRQQWATRVACSMAREAFDFYASLQERLDPAVDPEFTQCGYLFVCLGDECFATQRRHVALQNKLGIPSRVVTAAEAQAIAPGLDASRIVGGAWCEEDGYFDKPQAVVAAFAESARRATATFVGRDVERIEPDGRGWRLVLRGGEAVLTQAVVVAAAHDSPALLAPLGAQVPIVREPRYLFYSDPIRERLLEPLVISPERHFATKHLADGSVLASDLRAGAVAGETKEDWHRKVRANISELVPILEYVSFPVLVEGFYDVTPDRQPVLGRVGGHEGVWIAAGLNGRGLMMAPAIGRMIAAGILGDDGIPALLGLDRFERGELAHEVQVV
jgi:glycine/D-amino acid oxidase-like deaminating enzyme